MMLREETIVNTVSVRYYYGDHIGVQSAPMTATATVETPLIKEYEQIDYLPIHVYGCIPFSCTTRKNILKFEQELTPIRIDRIQYSHTVDVLNTMFSLHTIIIQYNPRKRCCDTYHWELPYNIPLQIPKTLKSYEMNYKIVYKTIQQLNTGTARYQTFLSLHILYEKETTQAQP